MLNGYDETGEWGSGDSPDSGHELDLRPFVVEEIMLQAREERARVCCELLKAAARGLQRAVLAPKAKLDQSLRQGQIHFLQARGI